VPNDQPLNDTANLLLRTVSPILRREGAGRRQPSPATRTCTLDQTAFYPTSGGQPFDTGTLGGAAVTDVIDREDGTIAHVVSGSPGPARSHGEIDWARRFDHMQQHTGQHVLSAAFDRLFGVRTESFHMGQLSSTIDLAREVSESEIAQARRRCQSRRLGGSAGHDQVCDRRGSGGRWACARNRRAPERFG
jgi:alanyl-tRNA synthetase